MTREEEPKGTCTNINCPERTGGKCSAEPDWSGKCDVCGNTPILPVTGMCGPCTFGEAETANGNW